MHPASQDGIEAAANDMQHWSKTCCKATGLITKSKKLLLLRPLGCYLYFIMILASRLTSSNFLLRSRARTWTPAFGTIIILL